MQTTKPSPGASDIVARVGTHDMLPAADEVFRPWAETMPAPEPSDDLEPMRTQARAATGIGRFSQIFHAIRHVFRR
jgi:hypothetical protein